MFNNWTVVFPNKTCSVALLDPRYTSPACRVTLPVVSKLIDSTAVKPIDFWEDKSKWSCVVLNTNLPEFRITCLPAYSLGVVGLLLSG